MKFLDFIAIELHRNHSQFILSLMGTKLSKEVVVQADELYVFSSHSAGQASFMDQWISIVC